MTTKPKAQKFRIRRGPSGADPAPTAPSPEAAPQPQPSVVRPAAAQPAHPAPQPQPVAGQVDSASTVSAETDIDAIRQEGLTGRQLRMARRVAQKTGLAVTSDFDAVRQLRQRGIDPFQRGNVLELVAPNEGQTQAAANQMQVATAKVPAEQANKVQLPQTVQRQQTMPSTQVGAAENPAERRASEIRRIQQDIARRRRRNMASLFGRLAMFVILPTIAAGYYFFIMATPMYGTKSEFVIQQAESQGGGGLGGLFSGTGLATQTDSTTVQSYMTSREAFLRLDEDHGFSEHFSNPDLDAIQRLAENATREDAYAVFQDHVQIGYDPTEGILKMEVIAADPLKSQEFSEALIGYAEEQVDQLTARVREDQMSGALINYDAATQRRNEALAELVRIQELSGQGTVGAEQAALQQRIATQQINLDAERLNLASLLNNRRPNEAQVSAAENQIAFIEDQIALLRRELTSGGLVSNDAQLRQAEENYAFEVANVQLALGTMDSARIEANRQVRYLSVSVAPIAPDEATYPKSFENTLLAFLIFAGIYLMISLTTSILREQVSS